MKTLLTALCAVTLIMTACQKEASLENPNSTPGIGDNTGATKLMRLITTSGDDSTSLDYSYDASGRVSLLTTSGWIDSQPLDLQLFVNRNAANLITSTVLKSPYLISTGFQDDSIERVFQYDQATGHYINGVSHFVLDDTPQSDSAVYDYDPSGNLVSITTYLGDENGYVPDSKQEFTYAGKNLASVRLYNYDSGYFVPFTTETYEYDSKINPQQSVPDAPVLGMLDFYSANNPTKRTTLDEETQESFVTSVTYSYNTANRPTKSDGTDGNSTSTIKYFYQ